MQLSGPEDLKVAAVLCPRGVDVDALLAQVAGVLVAEGRLIAGVTQRSVALKDSSRSVLHVSDLSDGGLLRITQDLGEGATGCRLDAGALAAAAGGLMARLETPVDALILNRFGKAEAEGHGLRGVAEQAVARGIPVLVGLREGHRADWEIFSAGVATLLPAEPAAVLDWLRDAIGGPSEMPQCGTAVAGSDSSRMQ